MFIRFVSGEIDDDSHLSAGLFCTVHRLLEEEALPDYEYEAQVLAYPFADLRRLL